ncbi:hypothetical protein ACJJTC_012866, partial [Scirpophaga incertulas]
MASGLIQFAFVLASGIINIMPNEIYDSEDMDQNSGYNWRQDFYRINYLSNDEVNLNPDRSMFRHGIPYRSAQYPPRAGRYSQLDEEFIRPLMYQHIIEETHLRREAGAAPAPIQRLNGVRAFNYEAMEPDVPFDFQPQHNKYVWVTISHSRGPGRPPYRQSMLCRSMDCRLYTSNRQSGSDRVRPEQRHVIQPIRRQSPQRRPVAVPEPAQQGRGPAA